MYDYVCVPEISTLMCVAVFEDDHALLLNLFLSYISDNCRAPPPVRCLVESYRDLNVGLTLLNVK
jgi:hypothetical protein